MRLAWALAAAAWGGIVALAWWLANERIERGFYGGVEHMSQVATRDNVLIWGLAIPLALFVFLLLKGLVKFERSVNDRAHAPPSQVVPDREPEPPPLALSGPKAAADGDD